MKTLNKLTWLFGLMVILGFNSCKKDAPLVLLFSLDDDIKLGKQVVAEIEQKPGEFPLLSETQYASAYAYINGIRSEILNSGAIVYKDEFEWKFKIIHNDSVYNAFCTPGGYIYIYTGLIKFLDSKDQLAGVIGHEMAHADRRHTSRSMQAQYGVSALLGVVLGNDNELLQQIAGSIYSLKNSRDHEAEADEYSVKYLCPTPYNAAGAAGFFSKLIAQGYDESKLASFFSTHPSPSNRVSDINEHKVDFGCTGNLTDNSGYTVFKNSLPQ